ELVDDAVVDVENVLRRLRENRALTTSLPVLGVIAAASREVRSGIVYATLIVVLVFIPLFALPGIEGRLFTPLGIAYIVSILASMLVATTITPVLCYYLLPRMKQLDHGDSAVVKKLKVWDTKLLHWSFAHARPLLIGAVVTVVLAAASLPLFPKSFLPPFNEGTLTINVLLNPGTALAESNRIGTEAERLLLSVPEVSAVGRRTGRAELDEHAEGVHNNELEVDLAPSKRDRAEVVADIRQRLATLPATISIGQPISHRLDHLLSGVRAQIALKVFGDDLDTLRTLAADLRERMAGIHGITDLQIEKQVLIPQYKIHLDHEAAMRHGVNAGTLLQKLETLLDGERMGQIIEGNRRFDLSLRLPEVARSADALHDLLIDTPLGQVPLSRLATIEDGSGPNQIGRENTRRRIIISANVEGADMSTVIAALRAELAQKPMPEGYFTQLEGQFQAQEQAAQRIAILALISLVLICLVLYSRYRSAVLTAIIMANIPLALVGSVIALWISGQPLSVAALVGFITLTGIATRNGILKISHY
ncbi:MAG TPA: efflux RND transporter permease subunit, partial [Rhodocyclaceae bacterium]|nr:efflux RND transporter permease subunit [Rhodocyclaceae bacterium]